MSPVRLLCNIYLLNLKDQNLQLKVQEEEIESVKWMAKNELKEKVLLNKEEDQLKVTPYSKKCFEEIIKYV